MKPDNLAVVREARKWLAYGDEYLRFANHGFPLSAWPSFRPIVYHAQQCAEKYLKGYLVFHGVDFPYTYSISRLLELCAE